MNTPKQVAAAKAQIVAVGATLMHWKNLDEKTVSAIEGQTVAFTNGTSMQRWIFDELVAMGHLLVVPPAGSSAPKGTQVWDILDGTGERVYDERHGTMREALAGYAATLGVPVDDLPKSLLIMPRRGTWLADT